MDNHFQNSLEVAISLHESVNSETVWRLQSNKVHTHIKYCYVLLLVVASITAKDNASVLLTVVM